MVLHDCFRKFVVSCLEYIDRRKEDGEDNVYLYACGCVFIQVTYTLSILIFHVNLPK